MKMENVTKQIYYQVKDGIGFDICDAATNKVQFKVDLRTWDVINPVGRTLFRRHIWDQLLDDFK